MIVNVIIIKNFRIYAKFTQDSGQMFLLALFYIIFEGQFKNYWVDFFKEMLIEMCGIIF